MKLTTLTISNFQCFGPEPTRIELDQMTYLLGPNGAGKTAVLHALARMFAVDPGLRGVRLGDFHMPGIPTAGQSSANGPAEETLGADVAAQTANGIDAASGFSSEPSATETGPAISNLWVEAEFTLPETYGGSADPQPAIPQFLFQMRLESVDGPMRVRIRLTATTDADGEVEERLDYVLARDGDGTPTKRQPVDSYARRRIQLHYLPARRNPREQISYASGSLLGNALRAANWQAETEKIQSWNVEITQVLSENAAISAIGRHLTKNWTHLHKSERYASPSIGFGQSDLDLLLRQLTVNFAPSHHGPAANFEMLSDGQQSLLYLTTVLTLHQVGRELLADSPPGFSEERFRPAVFTMLAVEEPENSLSPFYLGRVLNLLKASSEEPDCQVIIATHSPAVVRRVLPGQIRFLRLTADRTARVSRVTLPPDENEAHKYVQQAVAAYPELYFARLVVLGEGASEEVFLPRLFSAHGTEIDENSVAVVPLGGRHVNHMWRLLNSLGIPHITLLDLDRCRYGGGWGRVRTAIRNLQEFSSDSTVQAGVKDIKVDSLPSWKERDLPSVEDENGWLHWLETAGVFFSAPLDLDFLLLEHYRDSYASEEDAPEGDTTSVADAEQPKQLDTDEVDKDTLHSQILGKKGLNPTGTYSKDQLSLFSQYRPLFQLGSKPTAHLVALSRLSDEKLLVDSPPVMRRLVDRATSLLSQYSE